MQLGQYQVSEEELQGVWGLFALVSTPQSEAAQAFLKQCTDHEESAVQTLQQAHTLFQEAEAKLAEFKPREDALAKKEKDAQDLMERALRIKTDYENRKAQIKAIM